MDATWLVAMILSVSTAPFLVGFLITFLFTLFPGPMNAVVVNQMLEKGIPSGITTLAGNCLGGVTSVFIGALPFLFGVTLLADWLVEHTALATLIAAITLWGVGVHMMMSRVGTAGKTVYALWAYAYTACHPGNLLVNMALVTALQVQGTLVDGWSIVWLMLGYCAGCSAGWILYIVALVRTRKRVSARAIQVFKFVMGGLLVGTAVFTIAYIISGL